MHEAQVGNSTAYPSIILNFEDHATHVIVGIIHSRNAAPLTTLGHETRQRNGDHICKT